MRISQTEKMEIIRIVENSPIGAKRTLKELDINRSTFYNWYGKYLKGGYDGLADKKPNRKNFWNRIPQKIREQVVDVSLDMPEKSPREIAMFYTDHYHYHISESSVYRMLKKRGLIAQAVYAVQPAADEFKNKTTRINELWQTDFTYFKVLGWGWYYLSTIPIPIGGIIPWAKSIPGMPSLSNNFVECNGQTINDPVSPLNGQTIPNLNGENRFLRGGSTSGEIGGYESHAHKLPLGHDESGNYQGLAWDVSLAAGSYTAEYEFEAYQVHTESTNSISAKPLSSFSVDSRPPYYNVVWIMRVK